MKNLCKQNWYQITLLFLFCVTVFLRFYKLTVLPDVLHIDEAALGYNSWCLANYGTDRYLNVLPFYPQNFYGGQSPLYTYLVVLLIKFFGKGNLSVFLVRFPAAFASLLLWITGTRSMSLIFDNKKITLAAALFLCFCPYFVMSGRYALDCNLMLCCISCSVLVLLLYLKTGKLHTLLLSGVCFGISLYSYVLQHFSVTGQQVGHIEGFQKLAVNHYLIGRIEGADFILESVEVDTGFSTHGGINHGKQGGGDVDTSDTSFEGGCGKSSQVGHHASS